VVASRHVKMRVSPWIMLPNSAKTEVVYMQLGPKDPRTLLDEIDSILSGLGLPPVHLYEAEGSNIWTQDTMEVGYTQLPGRAPMHVVMKAQRGSAPDTMARTLLAPDFGFISMGKPRKLAPQDRWMDWMGNLEVSSPVSGYPLGRVYYGKSPRTTFNPTIVSFIEAQEVQTPFAIDTSWLVIQHVDEVFNFIPGPDGAARMIVTSPRAASEVLGKATYDPYNKELQAKVDADVQVAKDELGLTDDDIIELPTYYSDWGWGGSSLGALSRWSSPVNSPYVNGVMIIGDTSTPAKVKADIEKRLEAVGVDVAWVDDAHYQRWGGNVHCGTNTAKVPPCPSIVDCLPANAG